MASRKKSPATLVSEAQTIAEIQLRIQQQQRPPQKIEDTEWWEPHLSPPQREIFDSKATFILADGERFSGKTVGALHKITKHAWQNHAAHVLIIVGVRRQATAGGAWTKLQRDILPEWRDNVDGFEFSEPRTTSEKDQVIEVTNQHGTKSIFHLVSIPHGGKLADRIRGVEATAIFVDELVGIGGIEYFNALIQQIGRRVDVPISEQFYIAATNPDGPSHWVYKVFIGGGVDEDGKPVIGRIRADGSFDDAYHRVYVPVSSNPDPRAQEYYRKFVLPAVQNDAVEYQRLVEGKWVDRPSGVAIFGAYFVEEFHARGNAKDGTILRPSVQRGVITLGYDLGDVNSCVWFAQERFTKEKTIWLGIDEITYTDKPVAYEKLVPEILDKMNWWCELEQHAFQFEHISDKSAFDRFRASSGTYDARQIEQLSKDCLRKSPQRWPWLKSPIRLKECPKPPGSVAARIKATRELLSGEKLFLSAPKSPKTIAALKMLESEKDKPMEPKRSPHLHPYDAMSYVLYYDALGGPVAPAAPPQTEALKPQVTSFNS